MTDYNIASFICIILSQGLGPNSNSNPKCRKYSNFLIARARARGYKGDIVPVFKASQDAKEMTQMSFYLSTYICVNDFREMVAKYYQKNYSSSENKKRHYSPYWQGASIN